MERTHEDQNKWKVLTYQIPVPLGDCSIHVLMHDNEIKNCFIMDGGTNAGKVKAADQITNALDSIKNELEGHDKNNLESLKFDSWVVTHWDDDHWRGVAELVGVPRDNDQKNVRQEKNNQKAQHQGKNLDEFFKTKDPLIIAGAQPDEEIWKNLSAYGFTINDDYVGPDLICRDLFQPDVKCKLGQNFQLQWPDNKNNLDDSDRPRFVCLGAGGRGIDDQRKSPHTPTKNETSILSLLYWPSSNRGSYWTGGDGNPLLTKYLLDTFFQKSGLIKGNIKVIKLDHHGSSSEFSGVKNTNQIPSRWMEEDFVNMTVRAKPSKIIVTPGNQYGHPCWDVILFLYCWHRLRGKSPSPDLLYTTKPPYWISKPVTGKKDINITVGRTELANKMLEAFREGPVNPNVDMEWLYEQGYMSRDDSEDESSDESDEVMLEERLDIADMTCEWWNAISEQPVERPPEGVPQGQEVFYLLKLTSIEDSKGDGRIMILTPAGEKAPLTPRDSRHHHVHYTRQWLTQQKKDHKHLPDDYEREIKKNSSVGSYNPNESIQLGSNQVSKQEKAKLKEASIHPEPDDVKIYKEFQEGLSDKKADIVHPVQDISSEDEKQKKVKC